MPDNPEGLITMTVSLAKRTPAPCTTIEDCGHTLDNAMPLENGIWVCVHRHHGDTWLPITLDPIARNH